jgi:hypothetical protein
MTVPTLQVRKKLGKVKGFVQSWLGMEPKFRPRQADFATCALNHFIFLSHFFSQYECSQSGAVHAFVVPTMPSTNTRKQGTFALLKNVFLINSIA